MALTASFGTATAVTITLDSVTNGNSATSSAVTNFTAPGMNLEIKLGSVTSGAGTVDFYLLPSSDGGTDYATTETGNMRYIGSVEVPNASAVIKTIQVGNVPNDWKLHAINNSGQTLAASGNSVTYQTVTFTDV